MKTKFIYSAAGKKDIKVDLWPVIAFGYYQQYVDYDQFNSHKCIYLYFLFVKVRITQYMRRYPVL